jgi:hypothetical protein
MTVGNKGFRTENRELSVEELHQGGLDDCGRASRHVAYQNNKTIHLLGVAQREQERRGDPGRDANDVDLADP